MTSNVAKKRPAPSSKLTRIYPETYPAKPRVPVGPSASIPAIHPDKPLHPLLHTRHRIMNKHV